MLVSLVVGQSYALHKGVALVHLAYELPCGIAAPVVGVEHSHVLLGHSADEGGQFLGGVNEHFLLIVAGNY